MPVNLYDELPLAVIFHVAAKPNSPSLDTTLPLTEISLPTNNLFEISTLLSNDTSVNICKFEVLEPILFTDISVNLASVE